jgi:serine phosphatase RsbU (regulator of sigma subunit)
MDSDDHMFEVSRLREVLDGQQDIALDQLQKTILEALQNFTRGANQGDDITLLLVRYRAAMEISAR